MVRSNRETYNRSIRLKRRFFCKKDARINGEKINFAVLIFFNKLEFNNEEIKKYKRRKVIRKVLHITQFLQNYSDFEWSIDIYRRYPNCIRLRSRPKYDTFPECLDTKLSNQEISFLQAIYAITGKSIVFKSRPLGKVANIVL